MSVKITWEKIHRDFKQRLPNFSKDAVYWRPHDYGKILIYMKDGSQITYDYDSKRVKFLSTRWKK